MGQHISVESYSPNPSGRIRHIHIELVHNSASDFRYAVIIYHKPQHARLATALSGMMIRGHYIAVTLVNSCCEIIPYSPQTMNDVLLEQRERFYLHSNIPQVSIFDSATSVPLMMNKVDLFTTPHPSTCLPPSDCIESGSKLDEKDSDVKFLLDAAEMVVLHGRELDDRRFISDYDVSQKDEKKEVKGVAKERKMEKQKCVSQRADYNDWEDIVDLPEVCKLKANEDSRVKPLGNSRIINTNNHATHGNHHYYIKKHHRAS